MGLRNELKYLISLSSSIILEKRLGAVLTHDRHTAADGAYRIRSLYFDDPCRAAFYDKVNGIEKREKFRIRFYNGDLSFIRLEKKEKQGNQCRKSAALIDPDTANHLISGMDLPSGSEPPLDEMCFKIRHEAFRPLLFVDYVRKAFFYPVGNVRITLDSSLHAMPFRSSLTDEAGAIPVLEANQVILEVKFDSFLPPFISSLLEDIPKINVAISKYCKCYEMLNGEYV